MDQLGQFVKLMGMELVSTEVKSKVKPQDLGSNPSISTKIKFKGGRSMSSIVEKKYKDPFTYVKVKGEATSKDGIQTIIYGEGFAKRNAEDQPNEHIGFEIALSRAKQELYRNRQKIKNL